MAVIIDTQLLASQVIKIKNTVNELEQKFIELNVAYDSITKELWESPNKTRLDEKYAIFKKNYPTIVEKLNNDINFLNSVIKNYEQKEKMIDDAADGLNT